MIKRYNKLKRRQARSQRESKTFFSDYFSAFQGKKEGPVRRIIRITFLTVFLVFVGVWYYLIKLILSAGSRER